MRFLISSARKDLLRRLGDPVALLMWIGVPLVIGSLIIIPFGGADSVPKAHVLLVDQDNSLLSGLLANAGSGGQLGQFLDLEKVELDEGRRRIDAGEATALLIVPQGFGAAVLEEKPAQLTLITNPSQRILPNIIQQGLEMLLEAVFYLQRLIGAPLQQIAGGPPDGGDFFANQTVAQLAAEFNQTLQELQGTLLPPLLQLATTVEQSQSQAAGMPIGFLFLPGVLFMALMFIAQGMSDDLWKEKTQGALLRLVSVPQRPSLFLGGKLLASALLMAAVTLVGLLLGVAAFDVPLARLPLALLWCTFAGTALLAFFLLLHVHASSQRAGNVLSTAFLFPLLMLGGSFFPFETMPDWMAELGRWTPNGLAVAQLKQILTGAPDPGALATAALGIGVPALAAVLLSARRLSRRFIAA